MPDFFKDTEDRLDKLFEISKKLKGEKNMAKKKSNSKYPQGIDAFLKTLGDCDLVVRELENEGITVYQDGARLKKCAKITLKAGRNRILVAPLSPSIHPESMEASVEDKGVRISAVSYNTDMYTALPEEALQEEEKKTREELEQLNAEIEALKEEKNMLEVLMKNTDGLKSREEIAGIAALYHENASAIRAKIREAEKRVQEVNEHLEEVLLEIEKGKSGDRQIGYAEILIDAETDREIPLRLAMTDWAAGWNLNYTLRVEDGKDKAEVSLIANVNQNTEEDWKDAKLIFSSGLANSSLSRPVFVPERLGLPTPRPSFRNAKAKMSMAMADAVVMDEDSEASYAGGINGTAAPMMTIDLPEEAKAVENGNVIEFALNAPENIESGKRREILLSETELPAEQIYESYPKVSPSVWLSAKITETGTLPALDGNCRVFHNGAFAGTTWLSPEASEDGLTISLGTDDSIRVSRKDAGRRTEKGFLGSGRKNYYNYELTVQNLKNRAIDLLLIDQLPVSAKETIKVEATELSGAEVAGAGTEEGKVTWKLKLEPGTKIQKKFSYKVTYKE